jgi:hypothetical protein
VIGMETVQLEVSAELAQRLRVHPGKLAQILEWGLGVAEVKEQKAASAPIEAKSQTRRKVMGALRSTGLVVELDPTLAARYQVSATQPRRTPVYVKGKPLSGIIVAERGSEWHEEP